MSKNHRKSGQKFLQTEREFFFVSCGDSFFLVRPGQRRNVQKICLQSFKTLPFSFLEFLPKEGHSTMMDRHSSSPKSFLGRPRPPWNHLLLLWIYGMPARFDGNSAARSAKSWPPVTLASPWRRARSGCRRPYQQEVHVSYVKSFCDVISRDLFLCDSPLFSVCWNESCCCWAHKRKNSVSFKAKSNFNLFRPTCEKWVHSKNWFLWEKFVKYFTFGSGCTVRLPWQKKKTATTIMHKIRTLFLSRTIMRLLQWWFLLGNHNHQANPHVHQQHIVWATTFRSGLPQPLSSQIWLEKGSGNPDRYVIAQTIKLLVNVWICLMIMRLARWRG